MLITADPDVAAYAVDCGIQRIFVDLEIDGKHERQPGKNTVISGHDVAQIPAVRKAIPEAEILVRLNPVGPKTRAEVKRAVEAGADLLMVPMFYSEEEVEEVCDAAGPSAKVVPLVETPASMARISQVATIPGVGELYIGLNDLHLAMKLDFMFELLAGGLVDHMVAQIKPTGLPFGFGGLARLDSGTVPGEAILAEHARLGSTRAILSRAFHGGCVNLADFKNNLDLAAEVSRIQVLEGEFSRRTPAQIERDAAATRTLIFKAAQEARAKKRERETAV